MCAILHDHLSTGLCLGILIQIDVFCTAMNEFSGSIPSQIGLLTGLTWLSLYDNKLEGKIPSEIGRLTNLIRLELGEHSTFVEEIHNLWACLDILLIHSLIALYIDNNQLTGKIPTQMGNLDKNLTFLWLSAFDVMVLILHFCEEVFTLSSYHFVDNVCLSRRPE